MNEQVARFHVIYNERYKFDQYMEINKKDYERQKEGKRAQSVENIKDARFAALFTQ